MSKPSWFESTNYLSEISEHGVEHNILGNTVDLQKLRCLWLISFIQDMRNLMSMSSQLYLGGLFFFSSIYDAVLFIRSHFDKQSQSHKANYVQSDYDRLTCLFAISVMVQESVSSAGADSGIDNLSILDAALHESRHIWHDSVSQLRLFLHDHFVNCCANGAASIDYVVCMTDILGHLSLEAHQGIEKCLLNMLCRTRDGKLPYYVDNGGTPDSLLSTLHGF